MSSIRLGEYLVHRGLISEVQLNTALQHQQRTGERLGRLLLILGYVRRLDLARALADLWQLPFVTVEQGTVDPRVAQRMPLEATLQHRAVPLREDARSVTVAVADSPAPELRSILEIIYPGKAIDFRVTTEWDIDRAIASIHRRKVVDTSIYGLYFRDQAESAFTVFTLPQYLTFVFLCAALLGGLSEGGPIFEDNTFAWSGDHCSTDRRLVPGVLFASRSLPRAPTERPYGVKDVAATVLVHFGLDASDLDGRPLPVPPPR